MVWSYVRAGASWTEDQIKTTLGNVGDSTAQTYDIATGADDGYDDISRRQLLESSGALLLGYETAKELDPELQWKVGPFGKSPELDESDRNNGSVTDGEAEREGQQTQTEGDIVEDYESFVRGLENQDSESLDYVEGALYQDPGLVNRASVESEGLYVDSIVVEWDNPRMDDNMEQYLRQADQHGDLADWLSQYEEENL